MKTLTMTFVTETGDKYNLSLSSVKDTVTASEVKAAMDVVIAKNIFATSTGDLTARYSAQLTDRSTSKLEVL